MALHPENWSVIILGRWNRNILTPQRVWDTVFGRKETGEMQVLIPMDGISPYMLKGPHNDILFVVEGGRIRIQVEKPTYISLNRAKAAGNKVLEWLPETPVVAAGFNINFKAGEPSTDIAKYLDSQADSQLSGISGLDKMIGRSVERSFEFRQGTLNLKFALESDNYFLNCNFNLTSEDRKMLHEWLNMDIEEIKRATNEIFGKLELQLEYEME